MKLLKGYTMEITSGLFLRFPHSNNKQVQVLPQHSLLTSLPKVHLIEQEATAWDCFLKPQEDENEGQSGISVK